MKIIRNIHKKFMKKMNKNWDIVPFHCKIKYLIVKYHFLRKYKIKKYCNRGYHKIIPTYAQLETKDEIIRVDYLTCPYCEVKFFNNEEEKQKYIKIHNYKSKVMYDAFKIIRNGKSK